MNQLNGTEPNVEESASVKTGRSLEEIAAQSDEKSSKWNSNRSDKKAAFKGKVKLLPPKGRKAPWTESFSPQLATLVAGVPEGNSWLYEIKFDGYRLIAQIRKDKVELVTRNGQNWTEKFSPVAEDLSHLAVKNAILDGEVVVQNPDGSYDFQKLQNVLNKRAKAFCSIMFLIFFTSMIMI